MPVQRSGLGPGSAAAAAGQAQRLKPVVPRSLSASLKRCPDTNLFLELHHLPSFG
jgi:hypothetical protein